MFPPLTGIPAVGAVATATGKAVPRMEQLQQGDSFFSDKSYRAQLRQFLAQKPPKPLMFSFVPQEQEVLFGRLLPAPAYDIILATPLPASWDNPTDPPVPRLYQGKKYASLKQVLPIGQPLPAVSSGPNPFAQVRPVSLSTRLGKPYPTQSNGLEIQIRFLNGHYLASRHFVALEQAFRQAGISVDTPAWVLQNQDRFQVLPVKNPMQAGFQQVAHPWQGLMAKLTAGLASVLLGLKRQEDTLTLPNGARLPLSPTSWRDAQGKKAQLFQAMRLPTGMWFKMSPAATTDMVIPFKSQRTLRQTLASQIHALEKSGKLRETTQHPAFSVSG